MELTQLKVTLQDADRYTAFVDSQLPAAIRSAAASVGHDPALAASLMMDTLVQLRQKQLTTELQASAACPQPVVP